jgi:hypothetical protein
MGGWCFTRKRATADIDTRLDEILTRRNTRLRRINLLLACLITFQVLSPLVPPLAIDREWTDTTSPGESRWKGMH